MLHRSTSVAKRPFHASNMRNVTMRLRTYGEQYDRWVNVGRTTTDFLSYMIALVSASAEDSLQPIFQQREATHAVPSSPGAKALLHDPIYPSCFSGSRLNNFWPILGAWHLSTRKLEETMHMASSDLQHWTQRLIRSWTSALFVANFGTAQSYSYGVNEYHDGEQNDSRRLP